MLGSDDIPLTGRGRHESKPDVNLNRSGMLALRALVLFALNALAGPLPVSASDFGQELQTAATLASEDVVAYTMKFFDRFEPSSALAMVERIPGFQIVDGEDIRGFGGAAGNVLINDRYVSSKQDDLSSTLDRIPASLVDRIELLRNRVRGIDLRGILLLPTLFFVTKCQ